MNRALALVLLAGMGCECNGNAKVAQEPGPKISAPNPGPCLRPFSDDSAPVAPRPTSCPTDPTGNLDLGTIEVVFGEAPGKPRVLAEHALSEQAKERGLMYRTEMPEDAGMLFTWDDEKPRRFWMRNTCLPLDMIFIDSQGTVVSILEQVPTLNTAPRPSGCPARHVLEVNAGWARAHGVRPGQKVQIGT